MIRILIAWMSVTIVAGCGGSEDTTNLTDATVKTTSTTTENVSAKSNQASESGNDDHAIIVESCRKFETEKVCNCITGVIEEKMTPTAFEKIAEEIRNGAITPMSAARDFEGADKTAFETAMAKWEETCELN